MTKAEENEQPRIVTRDVVVVAWQRPGAPAYPKRGARALLFFLLFPSFAQLLCSEGNTIAATRNTLTSLAAGRCCVYSRTNSSLTFRE